MIALLLACTWSVARAAEPMAFQGRLVDSGGAPREGTVSLVVKLWAGPTTTAPGDLVYSETLPAVPVSGGYFSVDIGGTTELPSAATSSAIWIETTVDGVTQVPRTRIHAVPLAHTTRRFASSAAPCDGSVATDLGLVRFTGTAFEGCTTAGWASFSAGTSGTVVNPAYSCSHILAANPSAASGPYYLDPAGTGAPIQAYCDMTDGGWTLIFSSETVSGRADVAGVGDVRLASVTPTGSMLSVWTPWTSVATTRFTCDGGSNGSIDYTATDASGEAYAAIAGATTGVENFTIPLTNGSSFNNNNDNAANPDFWINGNPGVMWGSYDDYPYTSSDNKERCNNVSYRTRLAPPTPGTRSNARFFIWARLNVLGATAIGTSTNPASSCGAILARQPTAPDGPYWLNPDGTARQVYCDMANGGWALIFSSQTVGGTADRTGPYHAQLATLSPAGTMLSVWTPWTSVTSTRFSCDGGKNGSIEYTDEDGTGLAYAQLRAATTGIENFSIGMRSGATFNNNNDIAANPDFWLNPGGGIAWGSYDDYPYTSSDNKDRCNNVSYRTRTAAPTAASTSGGYFYIWAR
jgi:hypothetical protein